MDSINTLFHMPLKEMLDSDLRFTINRITRTVFIDGTEFTDLNDDGYVIIIYHPGDSKPLIISVFGEVDNLCTKHEGFDQTYTSEDGRSITFMRTSTRAAILNE